MAMKSQFQTLSFLSQYTPKSDLDAEFIKSFLVQRFQITPKTAIFAPTSDFQTIDVHSFIQWFESGVECLKIARFNDRTILTGNPTLEKCPIIASVGSDGLLDTNPSSVDPNAIQEATESEIRAFQDILTGNKLQPDPNTFTLIPQYIPELGERVIFYDYTLAVQGVGVARSVDDAGKVTLFCYFTYPTYQHPSQVGYSMKEQPGFNLRSVIFESIEQENKPTILGNTTSCFRRMNRELERVGKVWKDKLLRVEPTSVEVEKGAKYYYINDKLKVISDTDNHTPASHLRYLSGNYFTDHMAATKMLGKINELLRDYLASPNWPEITD